MNQSKFSQTDERKFLKSYGEYIVNIRPRIIEILCKKYKETSDDDEKQQIHIAAIEQFFLFYEAFEGFYRAFIDRYNKPFLDSLAKNLNIQNIYERLKNKPDSEILKELNIDFARFDKERKKEIEERIIKLSNLWKKENFYKAMKNLIPIFNKIKHKLFIMRNENKNYEFVLEDKQSQIEEFFKSYKNGETIPNNIDYLLGLAEGIRVSIKELIDLRLSEL